MLNAKDSIPKHKLNLTIAPSLGPQGWNYSNFDEFKSDILLFIKLLLYSSDFIKIIQFIETKIPNFFNAYIKFKLFLYKIQFFHSVLSDANKENLDAFYKANIYPLIASNPRVNSIQNTLFGIAMNPAIVKSRTYQQAWEECCRLFEIGIEKAINEIYSAHQKSNAWLHICKSKVKCSKCLDMIYYNDNWGKMDTIEENILSRYTNGRKKSYEYTSSSEDDRKVNNYDLYMNKINKQMTRFDIANNSSNNYTFSTPYESEFVLMEIDNDNSYSNSISLDTFNGNDNQINQKEFFDDFNINCNGNSQKENIYADKEEIESHYTTGTFYTDNKLRSLNSIITVQTQNDHKKSNDHKMDLFQFKFCKRENIDKNILRKFRKYLRDSYKKNSSDIMPIIHQSIFWYHFIQDNILPPCLYQYEKKEFKSFNKGFMHWVFEHESAYELYSLFLYEFSLNLINHFLQKYSLSPLDEEFSHLKVYITTLPTVYGLSSNEGNGSTISENSEYLFDANPSKTEVETEAEAETETNRDNKLVDNMNISNSNSKSNVIISNINRHNNNNTNEYGCNSMHPQSKDIFKELIKTKQRSRYLKSLGYLQETKEDIPNDIYEHEYEYNLIEEEFMNDSD